MCCCHHTFTRPPLGVDWKLHSDVRDDWMKMCRKCGPAHSAGVLVVSQLDVDKRPCERNGHNGTSTQLVTRSRSERDGETLHAGIDTRGVHRTFCLQLAVHMCCARVCLLLLLLLLLQLLLY